MSLSCERGGVKTRDRECNNPTPQVSDHMPNQILMISILRELEQTVMERILTRRPALVMEMDLVCLSFLQPGSQSSV